jgi:hypothetical protein
MGCVGERADLSHKGFRKLNARYEKYESYLILLCLASCRGSLSQPLVKLDSSLAIER